MIEISALLSATAAALAALLLRRQQASEDEPAPQPVPVRADPIRRRRD